MSIVFIQWEKRWVEEDCFKKTARGEHGVQKKIWRFVLKREEERLRRCTVFESDA